MDVDTVTIQGPDLSNTQKSEYMAAVKAPRTFDGVTCTKVNWRQVSMKESSSKVELN